MSELNGNNEKNVEILEGLKKLASTSPFLEAALKDKIRDLEATINASSPSSSDTDDQVEQFIREKSTEIIALVKAVLTVVEENEDILDRGIKIIASLTKKLYDAHVENGFSEDQAFQMICSTQNALTQKLSGSSLSNSSS